MGASMSSPPFAGLVIAGGPSSRMGRDKALLTTPQHRTLLDHAIDSLRDRGCVVAISAPEGRYTALPLDVRALPDRRASAGPVCAIEAGMLWAQGLGAQWLLTRPVDAPRLPASWLMDLQRRAAAANTLAACFFANSDSGGENDRPAPSNSGGRMQPLCAAWRIDGISRVLAYVDGGATSVIGLHEALGSLVVDACEMLPVVARPFLNINTPGDYALLGRDWPA